MWQPIESAPKNGDFIDAYDSYSGFREIVRWGEDYQYRREGWVFYKDNGDYGDGDTLWDGNPTHYKNLPKRRK